MAMPTKTWKDKEAEAEEIVRDAIEKARTEAKEAPAPQTRIIRRVTDQKSPVTPGVSPKPKK